MNSNEALGCGLLLALFVPLTLLIVVMVQLRKLKAAVRHLVDRVGHLESRGLVAEPFGPPESERWFLLAGRRRGSTLSTVHIAAHLREQLAIELMTPPYVAKLANTLLSALEETPELADGQTLVSPGDERAVWQAPSVS